MLEQQRGQLCPSVPYPHCCSDSWFRNGLENFKHIIKIDKHRIHSVGHLLHSCVLHAFPEQLALAKTRSFGIIKFCSPLPVDITSVTQLQQTALVHEPHSYVFTVLFTQLWNPVKKADTFHLWRKVAQLFCRTTVPCWYTKNPVLNRAQQAQRIPSDHQKEKLTFVKCIKMKRVRSNSYSLIM